MIPARINYHGNQERAIQKKHYAIKQLGVLHEQMIPGKLQTYKRTLEFDDGSRIICRAYPGELNIIDIYDPYTPDEVKLVVKCEIFKFDYENSPNILPKFQTKRLYTIGGYSPYFWKTEDTGYFINYKSPGNWVKTTKSYVDVYAHNTASADCPDFEIHDSCPIGEQEIEVDRQAGCSIVHWTLVSEVSVGATCGEWDMCNKCTGVGACTFGPCYEITGCNRRLFWSTNTAFWGMSENFCGGDPVPVGSGCIWLHDPSVMPDNTQCGSPVDCSSWCLGNTPDVSGDCGAGANGYEFCAITKWQYQTFWCGD